MKKNRKTAARSRLVYLRPPAETDFDELHTRFNASRRHLAGLANTNFDRPRFDEMVASSVSDTYRPFLICRSGDNAIVGTISLSQIFYRSFQCAYLGYQLFTGYTGQGYMTEAVSIALSYAFEELKLHRIEANVQPENRRSIAVLERTGFSKEGYSRRYLKIGGRWRDHERWAIIVEDWRKKKSNVGTGRSK